MMRMPLTVLVAAGLATGGTVEAQQVLVIDYDSGRIVLDDEWRAFYSGSAIDHERGVLYVHDDEEPQGIMAFSLETGAHLRTYLASTGDGPRELPQGVRGVAVGPGGRLYIAGMVRVLEFGPQGEYLSHWTPRAPPRADGSVCDLGGQPAVPALNGVIRRGEDGAGEQVGPDIMIVSEDPADWDFDQDISEALWRLRKARILCMQDAAFVLTEHADETDSLAVYYRGSNRAGTLPIPADLAADQMQTVGPFLETDGRGNLVLRAISTPYLALQEGGYMTAGAIIDPESGCHATIRNPEPNMFQPWLVGIHRDSAVVAYSYAEDSVEGGRPVYEYFDYANKVVLHPLRRVSGRPCAGMLPTVN